MVRLGIYFIAGFVAFCLIVLAAIPTIIDSPSLGDGVAGSDPVRRPGVVQHAATSAEGRSAPDSDTRATRAEHVAKFGAAMSILQEAGKETTYYSGQAAGRRVLEPTETEMQQVGTVSRWMRKNVETHTVQECLSRIDAKGTLALKFYFVRDGDVFVPDKDEGVSLEESTVPEEADPQVLECIKPQLAKVRMRVHDFSQNYTSHTIYRDYTFPVPAPK